MTKTDKEKSQAVWGASPAGSTHALEFEPGTKEFFEKTYTLRKTKELTFIDELIPFASFRDKKVLEIGCGVGYDAYDFCKNGAEYIGIDLTPENIDRCRHHLSYYGYSPKLLQGDAEYLQFPDESMDVVFSNGVLHHTPDIKKSLREAFRVLKPNGEFWIILYHKHSIFHWLSVVLFDYILTLKFLSLSYQERLSIIEYTTSRERPLVRLYSRNQISSLLRNTGFRLDKCLVRKLGPEDFPSIFILKKVWNILPLWFLSVLGKAFGWYVIVRGVKPERSS